MFLTIIWKVFTFGFHVTIYFPVSENYPSITHFMGRKPFKRLGISTRTSAVSYADLLNQEPHRKVGLGRVMTSERMGSVMVRR